MKSTIIGAATSDVWNGGIARTGSHLIAGWFWLFLLLFAIHDAEEAACVWKKGTLHNSISSQTLNLPRHWRQTFA